MFHKKERQEDTMVKSMTGFGRYELTEDDRKFTIEMKSVNHKFLDVNMKMPKKLSMFEGDMRNVLKKYAVRGKIDIFISYEDMSVTNTNLKFNRNLAEEYLKYFKEMEEELGLKNDVTALALSRCPEVLTMEEGELDEETVWKLLEQVLEKACEMLVRSREKEGENLKTDLTAKLDGMLQTIAAIEKRSPQVLQEYREKLENKMHELLADKMCVDEEIVRLKSHVLGMKDELENSEHQGRKLDFIAQEMNREANTILSKANDLEVTNYAIELKAEIEKIREQIQNIE